MNGAQPCSWMHVRDRGNFLAAFYAWCMIGAPDILALPQAAGSVCPGPAEFATLGASLYIINDVNHTSPNCSSVRVYSCSCQCAGPAVTHAGPDIHTLRV